LAFPNDKNDVQPVFAAGALFPAVGNNASSTNKAASRIAAAILAAFSMTASNRPACAIASTRRR
jgi:hypothetical protein